MVNNEQITAPNDKDAPIGTPYEAIASFATVSLLPSTPKSVETDSGKAVESASSFTTANAFEDWDTMDMCLKMIDDIEQMQGLTIEVLEKMATLAMEMRKVAYEFNSTTGLIQNGTNTDKTTQSLASSFTNTTVYRISEPSLDTVFTKELFITDEDDFDRIQSLSHEYDGDVLTADDKPSTQTLHSLQATSNVEQRKNDVIRRSLKILGRKSVGELV
ncbi:hypothetical protein Y032_0101g3416 [Ancylostoma ceylanicum]|uniref:Uncharacterized protein n=1 Tax=Ancylostoma ceylanicum TaxID=53326 RepID=A0A016THX6_9BILA|nr:hypothetical protein Y032_0101g3416 [Ancylostoma ceylanicum]